MVLCSSSGLYLQGRNVGENGVMVDTTEISASSPGDMEVRAPRFPKDADSLSRTVRQGQCFFHCSDADVPHNCSSQKFDPVVLISDAMQHPRGFLVSYRNHTALCSLTCSWCSGTADV